VHNEIHSIFTKVRGIMPSLQLFTKAIDTSHPYNYSPN